MKFKSIIRVFILLFIVSTILTGYSTASVSAKTNKTKQNTTSSSVEKNKQPTQKNKTDKSTASAVSGSSISVVSGSSISVVSGSSISLAVGEKQTVIVNNGMHYSITDNSIIKVNRSGKNFTITGKSVGVSTITIKDKRMNVLATIEITVTEGSKEDASDEVSTDDSDASSIDSSSESTSSVEDGSIASTQSPGQDTGNKQNTGRSGKVGKDK